MSLLTSIFSAKKTQADKYRSLITQEARIGGKLFGPIPEGHRREFFCLDRNTWVWHEEWIDEAKQHHAVTTRYDVRPNGILKSQGNSQYQTLTPAEARNLYQAVTLYEQQVREALPRLAAAAQ